MKFNIIRESKLSYYTGWTEKHINSKLLPPQLVADLNLLAPKLNPSAQRCLTRFFIGDFASWTVHFVNICVKKQQMQQLFIQFISYVW
jgi:hypothetical protein